MIQFILNHQSIQTQLAAGTTLLDFVRYHQHLPGTKIGCREGDCGACTVLVGEVQSGKVVYRSMTSCLMPLQNAQGKHIVTVEGLNGENLSPIQQAIVEEGGTQCGYCTVGFVVSFSGFALSEKEATYRNCLAAIDGNICRCTGYKSLERATQRIAEALGQKDKEHAIDWLIEQKYLPDYFANIPQRLHDLNKLVPTTKAKGKHHIVGGGTDLWVQMPEQMEQREIHSVFDQNELKGIHQQDGYCLIGAANTATDLLESPILQKHFPHLEAHMKLVSSTPIRNMGTIAGNLVNASPIGDLTIFFLALDAKIKLDHDGQKREIYLRDFYLDYKKLDKAANEIVESLSFALPQEADYFNFEKVCKRKHLDIATVNSACWLRREGDRIDQIHLSAGGVGPTPKYLEQTCKVLHGATIHAGLIQKAAHTLQEEISPISDARGAAEYKRLLLRQLFYAHFIEFFPEQIQLADLLNTNIA